MAVGSQLGQRDGQDLLVLAGDADRGGPEARQEVGDDVEAAEGDVLGRLGVRRGCGRGAVAVAFAVTVAVGSGAGPRPRLLPVMADAVDEPPHQAARDQISHAGRHRLDQRAQPYGVHVAELGLGGVEHQGSQPVGDLDDLLLVDGAQEDAQGLDRDGLHVVRVVVEELQHGRADAPLRRSVDGGGGGGGGGVAVGGGGRVGGRGDGGGGRVLLQDLAQVRRRHVPLVLPRGGKKGGGGGKQTARSIGTPTQAGASTAIDTHTHTHACMSDRPREVSPVAASSSTRAARTLS